MRRAPWTALALLIALAGPGACRCGGQGNGGAYDVGVPLSDLPRARPRSLQELVPGQPLAYAEARDPRALARAIAATGWYAALQRSGTLAALALSGEASEAMALAQRLNDLSRTPIGEEALGDLLDGPLAVALRPRSGDAGLDVLVVKALRPGASGALRLAQMLEAVHPSALEVRIERYDGIPLRQLRIDETRRLYYFVIQDRIALGTDEAWVKGTLDLATGAAGAPPAGGAVAQVRERCRASRAWLAIDGRIGSATRGLGVLSRALAGLAWVALRWNEAGEVELGLGRASGAWGEPGPPLAVPPGTLFAIEREVPLAELLSPPSPPALPPLPDAGPLPPDPHAGARGLLQEIRSALDGPAGDRALYALTELDADPAPASRHVLELALREPARADAALRALAPELFARPLERHDEGGLDASCAGSPPQLCYAIGGQVLAVSTSPAGIKQVMDAQRARGSWAASGAAGLYLDAAELASQLERYLVALSARTPRSGTALRATAADVRAQLGPLTAAFKGQRPIAVQVAAAPGASEAWGTWTRWEPRVAGSSAGGGKP